MKSIVFMVFVFVCSVIPSIAEEIKIDGGVESIATIFNPVKPGFERDTGVLLLISESTPKNGLIELLNGKLDAAVMAVTLRSQVDEISKDGISINKSQFHPFYVGINKTVIFVNKDNPVQSLSKQELKDIFTGTITNWKEVGGADKEIKVVWGKNTAGQNDLFQKVIMDGEPISNDILIATDYSGIMATISSDPYAIGIDSIGMQNSHVKLLRTNPEVICPVILVTKGEPSPKIKTLMDYLKSEAGSKASFR